MDDNDYKPENEKVYSNPLVINPKKKIPYGDLENQVSEGQIPNPVVPTKDSPSRIRNDL